MRHTLANLTLIACILFLGFVTGTGIYQHMFWIPEMFSSPTALSAKLSGDTGEPQKFWIPLHALVFLTLMGSVIFNWKVVSRKKLVGWAAIGYLYISVVSVYFSQRLFALREVQDVEAFSAQTKQWLALSWHRPILMVIVELLLLVALSRAWLYGSQPTTILQVEN